MISHKDKFIFIHIPKCGGSSVEKCLKWKGCKHHTMEFYKKENPNIDLNNYYKFTFVRNPWSRAVSWFFFHRRMKRLKLYQGLSFQNWCKNDLPTHWCYIQGTGWKGKDPLNCQAWITEQKQYDFIGRFENLQEDFNTICDKIGIPQQVMPHENLTKHKHYTEYYDDETREIIAKKYAKDIEYFGYKFEK